jgi:hypothetical protein
MHGLGRQVQPGILLLQLFEPFELTCLHTGIPLPPLIKGCQAEGPDVEHRQVRPYSRLISAALLPDLNSLRILAICSGVNCFFFIINSLKLIAISLLLNCPICRGAYKQRERTMGGYPQLLYPLQLSAAASVVRVPYSGSGLFSSGCRESA